MVKGKVFIVDMRERTAREALKESRVESGSSRLNKARSLDLTMREAGEQRGVGVGMEG